MNTLTQLLTFAVITVLLSCYGCQRTCETACLNNGTCHNGECVCTPGHWGAACEKDSCVNCLNRYVDIYMDEYFSNLDTLTNGFCEDCVTIWMVDTARNRATRKALLLDCLDNTQAAGQINLSAIVTDKQYQPVSDSFTADEKDDMIKLNSWIDFNPVASPGKILLPACR